MKTPSAKKLGFKMREQELENWIARILQEERPKSKQALKEGSGYDWDFEVGDIVGKEIASTFIDPWVNVLKVIGYEITQTIANITLTLRLFTTFNRKKAKEIIARHNDRMEKLSAKRDKVLGPLLDSIPTELHMLAFFAAPTTYMTIGVGGKVPGFARGTKDWLEQTGIIDVRAGEMRGEDQDQDRHSSRLEREREEMGPVKKALSALEQVFLLAHHEADGELIVEAEEENPEPTKPKPEPEELQLSDADIQKGLEAGGMLALAAEYQAALKESTTEVIEAFKSFGTQVQMLGKVATSANYDELAANLSQLSSAVPELDISELETFKTDLEKSAAAYAANEEKVKEIATGILRKGGVDKPTDEEIANVDQKSLEQAVMNQVFYGATSDLRSKIVNQLNEGLVIYEEMMDQFTLPTGEPAPIQQLIDDSEYAKDVKVANTELANLKQKVTQVVGEIEKPAAQPEA